ncbi:MAG: hypothetical protein U1E02_07630, partial [Hydrogenophaga sp.]|nr:hypothetical protein [Hydrogenophaga sp.]
WTKACGYQAVKKVYDALPEKYKKNLQKNCGDAAVCYGFSDMIYIPQRYSKDLQDLLSRCSQAEVFLEIALPMACACLAPQEQYEFFNSILLWAKESDDGPERYTLSCDVLHPFKFSDEKNQQFIKQQVEHVVYALSENT